MRRAGRAARWKNCASSAGHLPGWRARLRGLEELRGGAAFRWRLRAAVGEMRVFRERGDNAASTRAGEVHVSAHSAIGCSLCGATTARRARAAGCLRGSPTGEASVAVHRVSRTAGHVCGGAACGSGRDDASSARGLARLLQEVGFEVAAWRQRRGAGGNPPRRGDRRHPDASHSPDELGGRTDPDALAGNRILVLSQYVGRATRLSCCLNGAGGVGYLLKERVSDLRELLR